MTFAAEAKTNAENFSQEDIDAVAEEIQFYFEEVGYLDENDNYHIHNYELLEEKANSGDETAQDKKKPDIFSKNITFILHNLNRLNM